MPAPGEHLENNQAIILIPKGLLFNIRRGGYRRLENMPFTKRGTWKLSLGPSLCPSRTWQHRSILLPFATAGISCMDVCCSRKSLELDELYTFFSWLELALRRSPDFS